MSEWKRVLGYEGLYEVNELGQIRSLPRATTKGKILVPYTSKSNGYQYISLSQNNKRGTKRVHRIVMEAFCGKRDDMLINHKNGIKTDNRLENLEYCTQSENMIHAYATGLEKKIGRKCMCVDDGRIFESLTECAIFYGGNKSVQVQRVCDGTRNKFRGRRFIYV